MIQVSACIYIWFETDYNLPLQVYLILKVVPILKYWRYKNCLKLLYAYMDEDVTLFSLEDERILKAYVCIMGSIIFEIEEVKDMQAKEMIPIIRPNNMA